MGIQVPPVAKPNSSLEEILGPTGPDANDAAANRETWKQLRLETDKTLLQLSVGAIGLLIGFVAPVGLVGEEAAFFVGALAALAICVGLLLRLMSVNAHIMAAVIERDAAKSKRFEKQAKWLERFAKLSFAIAVVTAAVVSTLVGIRVGKEKEAKMSDDTFNKAVAPSEGVTQKSLEGAYKVLVPTPPPAPAGQPSQPTTPASTGGDAKKD